MVAIDPYYWKLMADDERNTINHYARMMGTWKQMIQREPDETNKQYFEYFMRVDEIYLEQANERLEKYRAELTDYELSQRELLAV
jgi:cyclopropane fatty-acyl-phospholipid synthase-like methyltransferase